MKKDQVPQDHSQTYGGHSKLMYATDAKGNYVEVNSTGWEVEEFATQTALEEIKTNMQSALKKAHRGECSPLLFHMYNSRMDIDLLAQTTGFFKWRIRRHLKPRIFNKLPKRVLRRYHEALGLNDTELHSLPESID